MGMPVRCSRPVPKVPRKVPLRDVLLGQYMWGTLCLCGMAFAGFQDIKAGDTIECFNLEEVKRSL